MITPEQLAGTSEHSQQKALFCWAALNIKRYPQLKWLFAVPNGFFATPAQKAKMKAEGLKIGVPDVWLPVPIQASWGEQYPGLVIEMKVGNNKPTDEQVKWLDHLTSMGYYTAVCYSWEEASNLLQQYLEMTKG